MKGMEPREPTPGRIPSELITTTPRSPQNRSVPLDAAVGVAALGFGAVSFLAREANRVVKPLAELALHPPLVPQRLHPARVVEMLAGYGQATTTVVGGDLGKVLDRGGPVRGQGGARPARPEPRSSASGSTSTGSSPRSTSAR